MYKISIIFVKGKLETLDYFIDECCKGAKSLGIECYVIDVTKPETYCSDEFITFAANGDCVGFIFNQMGSLMRIDGENFWDKYQIPLYDFMVDHPYNYVAALSNPPDMMRIIVLDREHEKFIRKYFPNIKNIHFMPNGGNEVFGKVPYRERNIDILYVGSCQKELKGMPKAPHLPDDGKEMYGTVFEVLKKNSFLTVEQAMEVYFENCCTYLNHEQIKEIIWNCAKYISIKIRRYYKLQIMHTLESTGAVIEIYGDNWEDNEKGWGENVHIHKRVSSYECNRLLGNAKIGLNCMPWYKDGCSERVFNIMLNGAVCLTDVSDYLLERFQQGKEVVFYELDDMDSLRENVVWLLQHPESAEKISKCGYDTAAVNDTWQKRMEKVLSFAQQDML